MKLATLLAGLATAASNQPAAVTEGAVAEAFRSLCLETSASPLPERASRAGFHPAPPSQTLPDGAERVATPIAPRPSANPGRSDNRETEAFINGSIRLFTTAGQSNPAWPLPPMCGVTADVADERDLEAMILRIMRAVGAMSRSGGSDEEGANVTLVGLDANMDGFRVSVVLQRVKGRVTMTLLMDLPREAGTRK